MPTFAEFQQNNILRVENSLKQLIAPPTVAPYRLHQAMRYSTLNGGKRIRALLVYATGYLLGEKISLLDHIASSIELIHAYSLIHDDLPAMDDDDLRRGKPSCHRAFGEANAILAGDALQTLAFEVLADTDTSPTNKVNCLKLLSQASGSRGMAGGQAIDLANTGKKLSIAELENMHIHKTGALIRACITLVACLKYQPQDDAYKKLKQYGDYIGLAFQVQDDILDETSSTEVLGKTQGKDIQADKATYPALLGLKASKELAQELHDSAINCLTGFDHKAAYLRNIADFTISRIS